jgi:hypothetical protein
MEQAIRASVELLQKEIEVERQEVLKKAEIDAKELLRAAKVQVEMHATSGAADEVSMAKCAVRL